MLAMNAGMINVLGLISLLHQSVSHMTGNASLIALSLADQDYSRQQVAHGGQQPQDAEPGHG